MGLVPSTEYTHGHPYRRYAKKRSDCAGHECVECRKDIRRRAYIRKRQKQPIQYFMWEKAKARAKQLGLPFDITVEDVHAAWPEDNLCPIIRLPLLQGVGRHTRQSPSIDRIQPEKGYVKTNIAVISRRANVIKQDCSDPEVFIRIAKYLHNHL